MFILLDSLRISVSNSDLLNQCPPSTSSMSSTTIVNNKDKKQLSLYKIDSFQVLRKTTGRSKEKRGSTVRTRKGFVRRKKNLGSEDVGQSS